MALLWGNIDSSRFSNFTNSSMMNYGIWLQLVTVLLLSIVFTFIGLRKHELKWTLSETYQDIDEELVIVFHAKLFQTEMKKSILSIMLFSGIVLIAFLCLTILLLSALPVDLMSLGDIGLTIFLSNVSILSMDNQLNSNQIFILSRYSIINNILLQLLCDSAEMKQRNVIIADDMLRQKEFQYTKYRNNFQSKNVLLRDQLEIGTITKSELIRQKKLDLQNQKIKLEEFQKSSSIFHTPMILIDKKTYFTEYTFTKDSTSEEVRQKLDRLFILHDKLTDCVDNLNDLYGLEMQLVTLYIFVYVVFGLFSRFCVWMNYQQEAACIATICIFWMCVYVHTLVFNIFTGTVLVDRAKETALILHRVMYTTSDMEVLEKLYQLSEMLYARQPVPGCGLLVWDWKYLSSLVGGVFMYLLILIQFHVSSL